MYNDEKREKEQESSGHQDQLVVESGYAWHKWGSSL